MVAVKLLRLYEGSEYPLVPRVLQGLGHVRGITKGNDGHPDGAGQGLDANCAQGAASTLVFAMQLVLKLSV